MYREILESINGVGIFPVLSLLIFVAVFSAVLFSTSRISRARLEQFAQMPLDPAPDGARPSKGDGQ
jgi:hypothetical protein